MANLTMLVATATALLCLLAVGVLAGDFDGDCPEPCYDSSMLCPRSRSSCGLSDKRFDTLRKICPATCKQCTTCIKNSALQACAAKVKMTKTCIPYARYDTSETELISAQIKQHCDGHNDGQKYVNCMIAGRDLTQCCINEGAPECASLCEGLYDQATAINCVTKANLRNAIRKCISGQSRWSYP